MTGRGDTRHPIGWPRTWLLLVALSIAMPYAARAQCAPIACGDTAADSLAIGETDCWDFPAVAGDTVSITAKPIAGSVQACWRVLAPGGGDLGTTCGQAERTLPATGTYAIEVFDQDGDESGMYDVNLVVVSETTSSCAQPIACGEALSRGFEVVADSDTFRFDGLVGETVTITVDDTGGSADGCWQLYDPAGAPLGGACGQDQKTLTAGGGYTIRVHDAADTHVGTYDLQLACMIPPPTTSTTTTTLVDASTSTTATVVDGSTTTTTLDDGGQPVIGTSLLLKDSARRQRRRIVLRSNGPEITVGQGPGSSDDPTRLGGSLRVRSLTGGFDSTYRLEPIGWRLLKERAPDKGWKYTQGNAIKLALLKSARQLRIVGRGGALEHTLDVDPNPVDVVFTLGAHRFCMTFGGEATFLAGKSYSAHDAVAPLVCPESTP